MKKVVGIYCGYIIGKNWDENSLASGIGGSETWAIYMASEFQKRGYHTIVFNETECWHFAADGVEYVPFYLFDARCNYQHFDYFISSRRTDELSTQIECKNIYVILHDLSLYQGNFNVELKKVACLSDFSIKNTMVIYPDCNFSPKKFFRTFNGVDQSLYTKKVEKENLMVWSSCRERGLPEFMDYVYPLIKKEVPDFKIIFADYNDIPYEDNRLEYHSRLSKRELADLQLKSKIWIYPTTFFETFCITAVENAMAGNAIITVDIGALANTLEGYPGIFGNNYLNFNLDVDIEQYKITAQHISDLAIDLLKNEDKRLVYTKQAEEICRKYTWSNSAETWIKEWEGARN